jgi:hypothetical protein
MEDKHGGLLAGGTKADKDDRQDFLSVEFDVLAAFLGLPRLESLLFGGNLDPMWRLVQNWWRHQNAVAGDQQSPSSMAVIPCVASPQPFKLIELPHLFQGPFVHLIWRVRGCGVVSLSA